MHLTRPVPFKGTPAQARVNRASHFFMSNDPDESPRCVDCDCRPSGLAADYPCGTVVPREEVR